MKMKDMDGIELARQIRRDNEAVQIIFITGYPDFMSEGYDVSALHYLMKPVKEDKLFEVLDKAAERLKKNEQTLLIQTSDTTEKVPLDNILYIEAFAHYIDILKEQLYISVSNSVGGFVKKSGGSYISTKGTEGHGFGLMRVDKIAGKYGGFINRQHEEGVFATEILLPLQ